MQSDVMRRERQQGAPRGKKRRKLEGTEERRGRGTIATASNKPFWETASTTVNNIGGW